MFIYYIVIHVITMENAVCVRLNKNTRQEILDVSKEFNYETTADFVREAIRSKLLDIKREKAFLQLLKLKGISKKQTSDKALEEIKIEAFKQLAAKKSWNLD